jgi:anti-sigma factor RsiW
MTDCPNGEMRDRLPDLLHGRLTPAEQEVVEAHVRGCADCRDELALLRSLSASLRRVPRVDVAAVAAAIPAYRRAPVRRSGCSSAPAWSSARR